MDITISDALQRKRTPNNKVLIYTFFKTCDRVNGNGVLVFTKAGTTDLKPVIITIAHANPEFPDIELSNYIRLNAFGQIPEDLKIDFIISDERGLEELYDIYIYTSDLKIEEFDERFVFRPKAKEYRQFLLQVLNDRPFLNDDFSTINGENTSINNLVQFGQFQAVTLNENPKSIISNKTSIAENIFYFIGGENIPDIALDKLLISNVDPNWNLESRPLRYLSIEARNKINSVPDSRYLALRFQNANFFNNDLNPLVRRSFVISFQARCNQVLSLNLFMQRVYGATSSLPVALDQDRPIVLSDEWKKFSIICSAENTTFFENPTECFLLLSLPASNIYNAYKVDITNLLVFFGDQEISYPSTSISTNQSQELIPQSYSPVINSPQGYMPLPLTIGRITEYLYEPNPQDKPTEIYADGRAVKIKDYYNYSINYSTNIEIPYRWLFEKYKDRYTSGKNFINAMSPQNSNNLDALSWRGITDFIIHTNDKGVILNALDFIDTRGNNGIFDKVNIFSYGYNDSKDYNIETYFVKENSTYLSLGIMVDSGFVPAILDNANFQKYIFSERKHQIGNTTCNNAPNANKNPALDAPKDQEYSVSQINERNFVLWGNKSLPTTLFIPSTATDATRYAKCITANSTMTANNFKFINANAQDATTNFSLRICIDKTNLVGTYPAFRTFSNVATPNNQNHAVISCYNPDKTNSIVLTQNMNIVPLKYQIAGQIAVGILLKTNLSSNDFVNAYFNITVKSKIYTFWYSMNGTDVIPDSVKTANPTSEDFIMINISSVDFSSSASITNAIMAGINSYMFCIPDLRGTYNFSAGEGRQSSTINGLDIDCIGNLPNPNPDLVNQISELKPILTHNFDNYMEFIPALDIKLGMTGLNSSTADTIVEYPISVKQFNINSLPLTLTNKYISLC